MQKVIKDSELQFGEIAVLGIPFDRNSSRKARFHLLSTTIFALAFNGQSLPIREA